MSELLPSTYTISVNGARYKRMSHNYMRVILHTLTETPAQYEEFMATLGNNWYVKFTMGPDQFNPPQPGFRVEFWLECEKCKLKPVEHQCETCSEKLCHQCFVKNKCAALVEELDTVMLDGSEGPLYLVEEEY